MAATNKSRRIYDVKRAIIVKKLSDKHKVTPDYVRKCISRQRDSEFATQLLDEYNAEYKKLKAAIQ